MSAEEREKVAKVGEFDYIEFTVRPKKDGLHDSGYRFIRLTGHIDGGAPQDLNQWSDHVLFHGPVNIDVTPEGVIRIMPWFGRGHGHGFTKQGRWVNTDAPSGHFYSSAEFYANDGAAAVESVRTLNQIHADVYGYGDEASS